MDQAAKNRPNNGKDTCVEFNGWDKTQHELKQRKNGNTSITISLDAGKEYR
jgi:1,4-alpha-glucan branching enzyme